jgi:DNA repair protein RadA/Sms
MYVNIHTYTYMYIYIHSILSMPAPPALVIVDSIQTMRTAACANGMGSITQIRESAARFVELAKSSGTAVLLIGHVTKAGDIAGPRYLCGYFFYL